MGMVKNHLHDQLGAFSFSSARLPADDDALVLPEGGHPRVRRRPDGKEMRGKRSQDLVLVLGHRFQSVDVEHPIGVDRDEDGPGVGVDEVGVIAQPQVPEEGGLVQVSELDHVLHPGLAQVLSGAHLETLNFYLNLFLSGSIVAISNSDIFHQIFCEGGQSDAN